MNNTPDIDDHIEASKVVLKKLKICQLRIHTIHTCTYIKSDISFSFFWTGNKMLRKRLSYKYDIMKINEKNK